MLHIGVERPQGPSYIPLKLSRGTVNVIPEIGLVRKAWESREQSVDGRVWTSPCNKLERNQLRTE